MKSSELTRTIPFFIGMILMVMPVEIFAQQLGEVKNLSLTIYNNNQALVNETRTLDAQKGVFTAGLDNISTQVDPSSVVVRFPGEIIKQNYKQQHTTMQDVLKSYIGHQIRFVNATGHVRGGELVALDGDHAIIHSPNEGGYIVISHVWDHTFILDNLLTRPSDTNSITWTLKDSKGGNQPFHLTYQAGGLNWNARYNLILQDDQKADLKGWANIENQTGNDFTNADITLLAGNINQNTNIRPLRINSYMKVGESARSANDAAPQERSFADYHLYELPGKQSISAHSKQMVPLVDGSNISVKKEYVYQPGYYSPPGRINSNAVLIRYTVINTKKNHLGKPLPAGNVSVYKQDDGQLVLLGKDNINHTAVNDSITVTQGEAFDVKGSDKVTDVRHISPKVTERDVSVELSNQKKSDITVTVIQHLSDRDQIIKSNYPYKKRSAYIVEFRIPVKSQKTNSLEYSVRQTIP
ncbi:MAG TPA: DUF4139 domain-containing protein [Balneolales bacterium]|nr:DUF4139 domain-containing protein [Balneolales bacterium]